MEGKGGRTMFDVKTLVEKEYLEQKALKHMYEKKLARLPKGFLSMTEQNGHQYYSKCVEGKKLYLGLGNAKEVLQLQQRRLLTELIKNIEKNESLLKRFVRDYREVSPQLIAQTLGKAYQCSDLAETILQGNKNYKKWGDQPYERNNRYPEGLIHRTIKGDMVRSKSEVIIANTLYPKLLQYRYEELTKVGKYIFAPDFKIAVPRQNKIKILEHFGMMNNSEYREKALWKINVYLEEGYKPYDDVLFTFDDADGGIDTQILDTLINSFLF